MTAPKDEATALMERALKTPAVSAGRFTFTVSEGADRGTSVILDEATPSRIFVGTSPACELRLTDRSSSRRHAALDIDARGVRLTDLDSTNGTFVNGVQVYEANLRGGELVRVGQTTIEVKQPLPSSPVDVAPAMRFGRMIGASPEMRRLFPLCERLAAANVPVVIEGETGTGKEVLAEALHEEGPRASGPFVVFDCTAVPPSIIESALFGHERGAFTGAVSARKGVFEQAHGGTLLIDEIGDLDVSLQSKLLRAIERSEVQRIGGEKFIKVDVRLLAATRRDLEKEIQAGRFRDDLFFRLAVARIELPPLRRRTGDTGVLARHFWRHIGRNELPFPDGLLERLEAWSWPGNVRELHNAIARILALGDLAPPIESARASSPDLSAQTTGTPDDVIERTLGQDLPLPTARQRVVDEFERRYIERVLAKHGGNVARAAAASGIARRYFYVIRNRQGTPAK